MDKRSTGSLSHRSHHSRTLFPALLHQLMRFWPLTDQINPTCSNHQHPSTNPKCNSYITVKHPTYGPFSDPRRLPVDSGLDIEWVQIHHQSNFDNSASFHQHLLCHLLIFSTERLLVIWVIQSNTPQIMGEFCLCSSAIHRWNPLNFLWSLSTCELTIKPLHPKIS